jgi:hypothetical protein
MLKVRTMRLIPLCAMLALPACVSAPLSVGARPVSCTALLPPEWKNGVAAPEFSGNGSMIGDWIAYADAVTGKLDIANDRTVSAIGIVERCEARDAEAVKRATRRRFLGL